MDFLLDNKSEYAVLIVRIIVGTLFVIQGYDKLFKLGLRQTGEASVEALRPLHLPSWLVIFISSATAIAEFAGGLLLITGALIIPACYVLTACLLPVTIGMTLREPMWNMQHVWTRLVMLVFLLVVPVSIHTLSLDHIFQLYLR